MLKERRELLEREISKLTRECGQNYLKLINTPLGDRPEMIQTYKGQVERLTEMKIELEIVIQLIEEGHD